MRVCTYLEYDARAAGVLVHDRVVGIDDLNDVLATDFGPDIDDVLRRGQASALAKALTSRQNASGWKPGNLRYASPITRPRTIWGVGLNFAAHAADLGADSADEPMGWMRPATTLAGHGSTVTLPSDIGTVTAEAEIAVVIGRDAADLPDRAAAREAVFGFMPVIDFTAEGLLRQNVRNLTRAKSYRGFCVTGPFLVTKDEWEPTPETRIVTDVDGHHKDGTVAQMRHDVYELVRFYSHVFGWQAGDILLTGTPGALPVRAGSQVEARIDGLDALTASVA